MLILTMRTDNPTAEIGLFDDGQQLAYVTWEAHRELSATIHRQIDAMLQKHYKDLTDLQGIVCFKGPGSFTGLRIGLAVANALAYSLQIPIVACLDDDWKRIGIGRITKGDNEAIAAPLYGSPVHITKPRH